MDFKIFDDEQPTEPLKGLLALAAFLVSVGALALVVSPSAARPGPIELSSGKVYVRDCVAGAVLCDTYFLDPNADTEIIGGR